MFQFAIYQNGVYFVQGGEELIYHKAIYVNQTGQHVKCKYSENWVLDLKRPIIV